MKMQMGTNRDLAKAEAIKPARLQLNIHPELHKLFRVTTFNNEEEMSEIVLKAVGEYLSNHDVAFDPSWTSTKPKDWNR